LLDAVTVLLDEAAQSLMTLTGERVTEAVVTEVFRHFCVGK
jgi:tRNA modification GTPase